MATVTFRASGTSFDVPMVDFGETEPIVVGEISDTYNGDERNGVAGVKRTWAGTTAIISGATKALIAADLAPAVVEDYSGDGFGGATVTCSGRMTSARMVRAFVDEWIVSFTLREVTPT